MGEVTLTVEQLAHIVCLPPSKQQKLLLKHSEGNTNMTWDEESHDWVLLPKE